MSESSELQHVLMREAAEDIERVKKRQYEVTNYGALISAALVGVTKLFTDDHIAQFPLYQLVLIGLIANGLISLFMQLNLMRSLGRFRVRLRDLRTQLGLPAKSVRKKTIRDAPLFLFFLIVPIFGVGLAALYLFRRSGLSLLALLDWRPALGW